jgi:hypothetical protein
VVWVWLLTLLIVGAVAVVVGVVCHGQVDVSSPWCVRERVVAVLSNPGQERPGREVGFSHGLVDIYLANVCSFLIACVSPTPQVKLPCPMMSARCHVRRELSRLEP